jgi:hypothetical protein
VLHAALTAGFISVSGLVLPVGLVVGPVDGVVEGAVQVGEARLELELGGDIAEREPLLRRRVSRAERVTR